MQNMVSTAMWCCATLGQLKTVSVGEPLGLFLSRCCTCSHQLRPLPCSDLTTVPRPHRAALRSLALRCASPPRRTSRFGPASSFLPSHCVLLLLLLLPGVNLRRREKKTYPSLCPVRGPLPICLHFPPRRLHWLPRRASQLAFFPSPSWSATARKHLAAAEC